jgi:ankyrin repeat protein
MTSKEHNLINACKNNDLKKVHSLVKSSFFSKAVNVNKTIEDKKINPSGDFPLHLAVKSNNQEMLELLISAGADITIKNKENKTALHIAAGLGFIEIAHILLQNGANVNEDTGYQNTPVFCAFEYQKIEMVDFLISKKADFYGRRDFFLINAINHNLPDTIKWLIEKGCNINMKLPLDGEKSLLIDALEKDKMEAAKILIEMGADVHEKDKSGKTPLHYASEKGQKEIVELLIKKGSNINLLDSNHQTALTFAVKSNKPDIAELIMKNGVKWQSGNNKTLIIEEVMRGNLPMVKLLHEYGADINAQLFNSFPEKSSLEIALSKGNFEMAKELVLMGASLTYNLRSGKSYIFTESVKSGNIDFIDFLLNHGADINEKNGAPLTEAINSKNSDIIEFLIKKEAIVSEPIKELIQQITIIDKDTKKLNSASKDELYPWLFHANQTVRQAALKRYIEFNKEMFGSLGKICEKGVNVVSRIIDLKISEEYAGLETKTLSELIKFYGNKSEYYACKNDEQGLILERTSSSGCEFRTTIIRWGKDSFTENEEMTYWN